MNPILSVLVLWVVAIVVACRLIGINPPEDE